MAFLDILVPYYNGSLEHIKRLLDSIKSQQQIDYSSIAVTIINDESDKQYNLPVTLLNSYKFKVAYTIVKHTGLANTKNNLIIQSTSDYFMFCSQDSYFTDNFALYNILNTLLAHKPDITITTVKQGYYNPVTTQMDYKFIAETATQITCATALGKIFKRDFILQNKLKFLNYFDNIEDYYFVNLSLQFAKSARFIPATYLVIDGVTADDFILHSEQYFSTIVKANYFIVKELLDRQLYLQAYINIEQLIYELFLQLKTNLSTAIASSNNIDWETRLAVYFYYLAYNKYIGQLPAEHLGKLYATSNILPSKARTWFIKLARQVERELAFAHKNSFSIILPTHNRAQTITNAIDSVLTQNYSNYEIIIIEDNCTDDTRNIVSTKYATEISRGIIKYIINNSNTHNASKARNIGLKVATNDWIIYLDDDNIQFPYYLTLINSAINRNPEAKCFYGRWINQVDRYKFFYFNKNNFNFKLLNQQNFIDIGVFIHNRSLIAELGDFNTQLMSLEDWDLILRYTNKHIPVALDYIILSYDDNPAKCRVSTASSDGHLMSIATIPQYTTDDAPSVTTLLLTYNHEKYIEEAIKSALIQRGNFKYSILISDDCSTDNTPKIIDKYAKLFPNLITVISPNKHLGLSKNYQQAISKVTSDYTAILEGDDYWLGFGKRINDLIKHFNEADNIKFVFSRANLLRYTDMAKKYPGCINPALHKNIGCTSTAIHKNILTVQDLYNYPEFNFIINWSSAIFKTAELQSIPECIYTDYLFSEIPVQLYLLQNNGAAYFEFTPYNVYRIHDTGVWSGADDDHKLLMIYQNRRSAYNIALPAGKKVLYSTLYTQAAKLLKKQLISSEELTSLQKDYINLIRSETSANSQTNVCANLKGIILAGGNGTRLYPLTLGTCKPLLPVYDKPMIYYPLSLLLLAGIKDILIITTPNDINTVEKLLGDGSNLGINISYKVQEHPKGIADAFILGKEFIGDNPCALALGDNIFYGAGLIEKLSSAAIKASMGQATIFGYQVNDPERFGIVELDKNNNVISIEEKPKEPKSNYCVTGLYFYPAGVVEKASQLSPSSRGELEITDLNNLYLNDQNLSAQLLGRGYSWMDVGTHDSLLDASNYIKLIQDHQKLKICCPEEIAFNNGWIDNNILMQLGTDLSATAYGKYLINLATAKNDL